MADLNPWKGPHWELRGRVDSSQFFRALGAAFPEATTLFIEAHPARDVGAFLRSAVVPGPYLPDRGTIWPKETLYRLPIDARVLAALADLAERHAEPEILSHMHLYAGDFPLLSWYDALSPGCPVWVSDAVDAERIRAFASGLGFSVKRVGP